MLYPKIASRKCEDCQKYVYDDETGEVQRMANGDPQRRYPGIETPCRYGQGCPKGTPEDSREITEQNYRCWVYLRECRAVHQWPNDSVVRRNAAVLEWTEQQIHDMRQREIVDYVKLLNRLSMP